MRFVLAFSFALVFSSAISQSTGYRVKPFIEAGVGIATGISRYVYTKFVDPRVGLNYHLSEKIGLSTSLGYVYFFRKSNKEGVAFLPISAALDYDLVSNLFLEMQVGGALILDGTGGTYFLAEPGVGWKFNHHNIIRMSYYGFVTSGLAIGGVNFAYRFQF